MRCVKTKKPSLERAILPYRPFGLLLILLALTFSHESWAWAPSTHLYYALEAVHFGNFLPSFLLKLLNRYQSDFLYGTLAADITLGKAYVEYIYNCHNFDVGFLLLDKAKDESQAAFVYGYLAHLATDTVSHNFFVPYENVRHLDYARFRHAYWEVRLDETYRERVSKALHIAMENPRTHSHDGLLDEALKDTLFSFKTNRFLFSRMFAIQRLRKWHQFVKRVNQTSPRQLVTRDLSEYNRLAVSAILLLLSEGAKSCVYRVDPTGDATLNEAKTLRKTLRDRQKQSDLTPSQHDEICHDFRSRLRHQFFKDYLISDAQFKPSIHMEFHL